MSRNRRARALMEEQGISYQTALRQAQEERETKANDKLWQEVNDLDRPLTADEQKQIRDQELGEEVMRGDI